MSFIPNVFPLLFWAGRFWIASMLTSSAQHSSHIHVYSHTNTHPHAAAADELILMIFVIKWKVFQSFPFISHRWRIHEWNLPAWYALSIWSINVCISSLSFPSPYFALMSLIVGSCWSNTPFSRSKNFFWDCVLFVFVCACVNVCVRMCMCICVQIINQMWMNNWTVQLWSADVIYVCIG